MLLTKTAKDKLIELLFDKKDAAAAGEYILTFGNTLTGLNDLSDNWPDGNLRAVINTFQAELDYRAELKKRGEEAKPMEWGVGNS